MKETQSLIRRAEKYLASAQVLIEFGDFESAISRVYYAMYFLAEAALLEKGLSFSSHKAVIAAFGENFLKNGIFPRELGRELNRAFEKRQLSDYEHDFIISESEALHSLEKGKEFFATLSAFLNKE